ncbi:hypothetical protein BGZ75_004590, partial [Mortierella antarctica]
KYRYEKGVASLLDTYADSGPAIRDAIIRFLVDRIRPSPKYSSSLVILCRSWNYGNRLIFEEVIAKLLPEGDPITWIPDSNATKNEDPLSILTKIARSSPSVLDACKVIMDYCVNHAIKSKNLSFLAPFFRSLRRIVVLFPNAVQVYLRRIAYIPVSDRWRDYIVENSTIVYSPWQWIWFRKTSLRLERIKKPVMQLHVTTGGKRNKADTFTRPIYVAAFDALWHFKDSSDSETKRTTGESAIKQVSIAKPWSTIMERSMHCLSIIVGSTVKQELMAAPASTHESVPEAAPTQDATAARSLDGPMNQATTKTQKTTWWKTLFHMIWFKFHLRKPTYVTCHDFSVEFRNNPAIAALVEYKWNTIGYAYWAVRFFFHCVFYGLVIAAALLQIYHENVRRSQLQGVAVAIIAVGSAFLWLELVQAFKNFRRYRRDSYNLFDIVAYTLPMAAAFTMLKALRDDSTNANTRILSWSVLIVLLHMVFELRVYESVGQYETFIRESVNRMRAFFLIFAGGLVAFTIAILHLLRACPLPGSCEVSKSEFSKHFLGALSATYFFMGGRFDPVAVEFQSEDWTFHIMMMVYFFFTVIIMLNMLIALIHVAFANSDDGFSLIESRLHYIELAENLSYHIPGFRQTYNWFPREIYYSATAREIQIHEETIRAAEGEAKDSLENDPAIQELREQVQDLKHQLVSQQEREERRFEELKGILLGRA